MRANADHRLRGYAYWVMATVLAVLCTQPRQALAQSYFSPSYAQVPRAVEPDDDFRAAELYRHARQDYQSGDLPAAMRHLRELVDRFPTSHFARPAQRSLRKLASQNRARRTRLARTARRANFAATQMAVGLVSRSNLGMHFIREDARGQDDEREVLRLTISNHARRQGESRQLGTAETGLSEAYGPIVPKYLRSGRLSNQPMPPGRAGDPLRYDEPTAPITVQPQHRTPPLVIARAKHRANDSFMMATADRVFFGQASVGLGTRAREVVREQARWLAKHPDMAVTINGHADENGTRAFNRTLSRQRAQAVRGLLLQLGIAPDRISIAAHGRMDRVALCDSRLCMAQNRRVITKVSRTVAR